MNADEFVAWSMGQGGAGRFELEEGRVVKLEAERPVHVRAKLRVTNALNTAIRRQGLDCEAFIDGPALRIDDRTVFEPDVLVSCNDPIADNDIVLRRALIVVEVVSPTSEARDAITKLAGYLRVEGLQHYLIVVPHLRKVVHHRRDERGEAMTRIAGGGNLALDPPGLELSLAEIFA